MASRLLSALTKTSFALAVMGSAAHRYCKCAFVGTPRAIRRTLRSRSAFVDRPSRSRGCSDSREARLHRSGFRYQQFLHSVRAGERSTPNSVRAVPVPVGFRRCSQRAYYVAHDLDLSTLCAPDIVGDYLWKLAGLRAPGLPRVGHSAFVAIEVAAQPRSERWFNFPFASPRLSV